MCSIDEIITYGCVSACVYKMQQRCPTVLNIHYALYIAYNVFKCGIRDHFILHEHKLDCYKPGCV